MLTWTVSTAQTRNKQYYSMEFRLPDSHLLLLLDYITEFESQLIQFSSHLPTNEYNHSTIST